MVLFIDAVMGMHDNPRVFKIELEPGLKEDLSRIMMSIDPHDVPPSILTLLAYTSGARIGECYILGIPVSSLEFGSGLSTEAMNASFSSLDLLEKLLARLDCAIKLDRECIRGRLEESCGKSSIGI